MATRKTANKGGQVSNKRRLGADTSVSKQRAKKGHPVEWTEERRAQVFEEIVDRMCEGELITDILGRDKAKPGYPTFGTFIKWVNNDADLQQQYAHAREIQADREFDELRKIADTPMLAERIEESTDDKGKVTKKVVKEDAIGMRRLMYEARKFRIGKMSGKYNDKIAVDLNKRSTVRLEIDLGDDDENEDDETGASS